MPGSEAPDSFWRCVRCSTPNPTASYLTHCVGCGAPRQAAPATHKPTRRGVWVAVATWSYAALVLLILALTRWLGDLWWPTSILLFLPRSIWLLPIVGLALAAIRTGRRSLWSVQIALILVIVGPLMGFSLPLGSLLAPQPQGVRLRILSLNRGSDGLDVDRLIALLDREQVDLICFQEGPLDGSGLDPKLEAYFAKTWYRTRNNYLASRFPIQLEKEPLIIEHPEHEFWPVRLFQARIQLPSGETFLLSDVHMPTVRYGFKRLFRGDLAGFRRYLDWRWDQAEQLLKAVISGSKEPILLAGDFNMPADSQMMDLFRAFFRLGFDEVGWGFGYTRPSAFPWIGIDHILATPEWQFTRCWIGPNVGSDHLPVLAEVVLRTGQPPAPASKP